VANQEEVEKLDRSGYTSDPPRSDTVDTHHTSTIVARAPIPDPAMSPIPKTA
jgi:hypothetical protein